MTTSTRPRNGLRRRPSPTARAQTALVAVGAMAGTLARWALTSTWDQVSPEGVILVINVVGSLVLGALLGATPDGPGPARLAIGTGFAGGFTTFSTFALQGALLLDEGALGQVAMIGLGTPVLALLAAGLGYRLGRLGLRVRRGARRGTRRVDRRR